MAAEDKVIFLRLEGANVDLRGAEKYLHENGVMLVCDSDPRLGATQEFSTGQTLVVHPDGDLSFGTDLELRIVDADGTRIDFQRCFLQCEFEYRSNSIADVVTGARALETSNVSLEFGAGVSGNGKIVDPKRYLISYPTKVLQMKRVVLKRLLLVV